MRQPSNLPGTLWLPACQLQVAHLLVGIALIGLAPGFSLAEVVQEGRGVCALPLLPHSGDARVDRDIVHYQARARAALNGAGDPVPWLERLGWALVAKARESFDSGFYTLASSCADCLEQTRPGTEEALLLRGHVLVSLHRFAEAESVARKLVERRGAWFDEALLGDALMEQGKLEAAVKHYQAMVDRRPGPQAYTRIAHLRWLKGDLPGAIDLLRRAVRATDPREAEASAWTLVRLAQLEHQTGTSEAAERSLGAALELVPNYAPALLARGRWRLARGEAEDALPYLRSAEAANPLPEYRWALIEGLHAAGQAPEAAAVKARLSRSGQSDDPRTFSLYLATCAQDAALAVRLAQSELKARADVFTLDALAWAYRAAGRLAEAREHARGALAEGTIDARIFLHAGLIASESGDRDEARRLLDLAHGLLHTLLPSERLALERGLEQLARKS